MYVVMKKRNLQDFGQLLFSLSLALRFNYHFPEMDVITAIRPCKLKRKYRTASYSNWMFGLCY